MTAQPRPADLLAPDESQGPAQPLARLWLLRFPGLEPVVVAFAPAVDRVGALAAYPEATEAEPMVASPAGPLPADLAALVEECHRPGLLVADDDELIADMHALDPGGTVGLLRRMLDRAGQSRACGAPSPSKKTPDHALSRQA